MWKLREICKNNFYMTRSNKQTDRKTDRPSRIKSIFCFITPHIPGAKYPSSESVCLHLYSKNSLLS